MPSSPENPRILSRPEFDRTVADLDRLARDGVLDCRATLTRLDNDLELFQDLVGYYFRDAPQLLGDIRRSIAAHDAAAVRRWAHRLKGLVSNFDARHATTSAGELEQLAFDGQLEQAPVICDRLEKELDELTEQLRRF